MIFYMIFLMIHKISCYKVRVFTGCVETRWLGCQLLNGSWKQCWQAGCWLHQCVLRNSLAGSFRWFLCPGTLLYQFTLMFLDVYNKQMCNNSYKHIYISIHI